MYALINNNTVAEYPISLTAWRNDHPNITLPTHPTDIQLLEQNIVYVEMTTKPQFNSILEKCVEGTPFYENGSWRQTWNVIALSEEEIVENELNAKKLNKQQAMQLLTETDWTQMPDVNLLNKDEFTAYRAVLRQIAINPQIDVTWPTKPSEQW